jgi:hypothetical protein
MADPGKARKRSLFSKKSLLRMELSLAARRGCDDDDEEEVGMFERGIAKVFVLRSIVAVM